MPIAFPPDVGSAAPTEIVPGLHVGPVEYRGSHRYCAVVTVLSERERDHYRQSVPYYRKGGLGEPSVPSFFIAHRDREPGLVAKCLEAWEFIDRHLPTGNVLVHCAAGASRSPTVVAGWLMTRRGMSAEDAIGHLLRLRPQVIHLWTGFIEELLGLRGDE